MNRYISIYLSTATPFSKIVSCPGYQGSFSDHESVARRCLCEKIFNVHRDITLPAHGTDGLKSPGKDGELERSCIKDC